LRNAEKWRAFDFFGCSQRRGHRRRRRSPWTPRAGEILHSVRLSPLGAVVTPNRRTYTPAGVYAELKAAAENGSHEDFYEFAKWCEFHLSIFGTLRDLISISGVKSTGMSIRLQNRLYNWLGRKAR
jgi:hypothetical protein